MTEEGSLNHMCSRVSLASKQHRYAKCCRNKRETNYPLTWVASPQVKMATLDRIARAQLLLCRCHAKYERNVQPSEEGRTTRTTLTTTQLAHSHDNTNGSIQSVT